MTTTLIQVTAADIRAGKPGCFGACPIALALNRALGGEWSVFMWFGDCNDGRSAKLSYEAMRFQDDFDAGDEAEPFEFYAEEVE